ncbi:MAG: hypothetical protein JXB25_09680 [Deltaproteobacteria bacterium]|nr:hypothetical protein [Deltaproteobacteria bacterium]
MKRIQKMVFWGLALTLFSAVYANGEIPFPLKQKDAAGTQKKAVEILPDLIVQKVQLSGFPKEGENIGAPVFFRIMVKNASVSMARGSGIRVQCGLNNSQQKQCPKELNGFLNIPDLPGGKTVFLEWPKSASGRWVAGEYSVTVEADYQNRVQESNEKNNQQTLRFNIEKSQARPLGAGHNGGSPHVSVSPKSGENQFGHNLQPSIPISINEHSPTGVRAKSEAKPGFSIVPQVSSRPGQKMKISDEAICRNYAQDAVNQFIQAENNRCGFQGGRWHNDFDKHFNWCLSATQDKRKMESGNRRAALISCGEIKRFDNPRYLGLLADFCMYRETRTYHSTPIEGEVYDYDFGSTCGVAEVARSYCISQGYEKEVEFKVADHKAQENTMPLGNHHHCDATIARSNCRGFDYIICRKPVLDENMLKKTAQKSDQTQMVLKAKGIKKKDFASLETKEGMCQDYAQTAVQQYHQATNSFCNLSIAFEAGRWHGNFKIHYNWCLTASPDQIQAEVAKRRERLTVCAQTERKRYEKPMFNGKRVDTFVNFREGNRGEPEVPQRAADLFCQEMEYEKAISEWAKYNSTFATESLNNTIHMGAGHPECNTGWPSFNKKCEGFNHITCERPAQP